MAAAVGGWASLKSEAKTLEAYCEMRLNNSAAATSSMPSDVESGDPGAVRLREIEDSLSKLTSVIERLGAAATASASSANAAVAQHFREVLVDLRNEFRRQSTAHRSRVTSSALFGTDINSRNSSGGANADSSADEILLRERASLQGSSRAIDDVMSQASATSDVLRSQRGTIGAAAGRLTGILGLVPGATALMGAINERRSRNDTIVYLLMAACVCYTAYFLLSSRV